MERRYAPAPGPLPRHKACLWHRDCGTLRMIQGQASTHRTRGGILYNQRVRLMRRFGFTSFKSR
jgi:hypothetical protein